MRVRKSDIAGAEPTLLLDGFNVSEGAAHLVDK